MPAVTHATTRFGPTDLLLATSARAFGADQFYGDFNSWERTKGWFGSVRQALGPATEVDFAFRRHTDLFVLYRDDPDYFTNRHSLDSWDGALRRSQELGPSSRLSYGVETYSERIASSNLGDHSRVHYAGYIDWDTRVLRRFSFAAGLRDEVYGGFQHQLCPTVSGGAWLSSSNAMPRRRLR